MGKAFDELKPLSHRLLGLPICPLAKAVIGEAMHDRIRKGVTVHSMERRLD